MRRILYVALASVMMVLAGCAAPAATGPVSPDSTVSLSVTPAPITAEDAIAAASADELRELIAQYKNAGDYELVYASALRLTELDPSDADAYIIASEALLKMSQANIDEVNRLLAQGAEKAQNAQAVTDWASQNQPDFSVIVPFVPDYASADEINMDGITAGNQTNAAKYNGIWRGGLMTWQGDWTYLSRPDEDFAIYKMRADGSDYQPVGNAHGCSLNVIGDWIYFINVYDGDTPYRMHTDGSPMEKLSNDCCSFLSVEGDYMYYDNGSDSGCLYKTRIGDASEQTKLSDGTTIFSCVADGWVYYCEKKPENAGFCRVSVDGGKPQTIMAADMRNYCIEGDWIYYFFDMEDTSGVWRVHTDGTGAEMFFPFDFRITTINIANNTLAIGFGVAYEEDGFYITEEIVMIDIATKDKVAYVGENTEAIGVGSGGDLYFGRNDESLAWYRLEPDGSLGRVG